MTYRKQGGLHFVCGRHFGVSFWRCKRRRDARPVPLAWIIAAGLLAGALIGLALPTWQQASPATVAAPAAPHVSA